jgi:hypothetical protein
VPPFATEIKKNSQLLTKTTLTLTACGGFVISKLPLRRVRLFKIKVYVTLYFGLH